MSPIDDSCAGLAGLPMTGVWSSFQSPVWNTRPTAVYANLKAFLVNRVGDFGFVLGIMTVFWMYGTIEFAELFPLVASKAGTTWEFLGVQWSALDLAGFLLFIGASFFAKLGNEVSRLWLAGFFLIEAKFWGVVGMGAAVLILFTMPWIDHSPVRSIRYRPGWHKWVYGVFVVVFLVLGYLGVQPPEELRNLVAKIGTLLYFAFFMLMPWWSAKGEAKPVPGRVTYHAH